MSSFSNLTGKEAAALIPAVVTGGLVVYMVLSNLLNKAKCGGSCASKVNPGIEKDKAKVVNSFEIEELPDQVAFCRCWRSSKFPYCDGTHNKHNVATGDNVGPLCLKRK